MATVYYCLNGFGYFGTRSLRSAIQLAAAVPVHTPPLELEIFRVADPSEARREAARAALGALDIANGPERFRSNIDEVLEDIEKRIVAGLGPDDVFLLHDCSPTHLHHANVYAVQGRLAAVPRLRQHLRYLVEKPAMTTYDYAEDLEAGRPLRLDDGCFCDYIELQSQTFLQAREIIAKGHFEPRAIRVWRNSGTGFKRLYGRSRAGVTGGALEDKAAHDLALTLGYLGLPTGNAGVRVLSAEIENFMPAEWRSEEMRLAGRPAFATVNDSIIQRLDRQYASLERESEAAKLAFDVADARVQAQLLWPTAKGDVACSYSFAWDGIDQNLRNELADVHLPHGNDWLGGHWLETFDGRLKYWIEEARIHILEDAQGNRLVLNFLTKLGAPGWIAHIPHDSQEAEPIEVTSHFGGNNSLVRILRSLMANEAPDELGTESTSLISRIAYDIRCAATDRPAPPSEVAEYEATLMRFQDRSRLTKNPATQGLIFALDNVLFPSHALGPEFIEPVVQSICDVTEDVDPEWLAALRQGLFGAAFDVVVERLGLDEMQRTAGERAFGSLAIPPGVSLDLYPDARSLLARLARQRPGDTSLRTAVVTRGFRELQRTKIETMGLRKLVDECHIDAIDDGRGRPGQRMLFKHVAEQWGLKPRRVTVVGADPASELAAALEVGMQSVLVDRGSAGRDGDGFYAGEHYVVSSLDELADAVLGPESEDMSVHSSIGTG